jgi:hypothetical protein
VQQCRACNTDILLDLRSSLLQLGSFADWLQQHPGLVRSISMPARYLPDGTTDIHGQQEEVHYRTVFQLLQQAMQLATMHPATAAAAATAAAGIEASQQQQEQQQQQRQQGLQLVNFSSSCLGKPGVEDTLAALPAHSLTQLHLTQPYGDEVVAAAMPAVLTRLSNLQQLHLESMVTATTGNCLAGILRLSRLTSLQLEGCEWCGSNE